MGRTCLGIVLVICCGALRAAEIEPLVPVASPEPGWPQWRGPRRDGICDEKGLTQSWPVGGPKLLWSVSGLGAGWSGPIISRGAIYITGDIDDALHIFALDMNGQTRWRTTNGSAWKGPYPGARASCRYEDGAVYHINAHGRVVCLDARTGAQRWAVDTLQRFEGKNITWGLAENVLIDRGRVIVTPGGAKGMMVALDRQTGQTVWSSGPLLFEDGADGPSYASPVLFELGGKRHIVGSGTRHVFGVEADTGRFTWTRPLVTRYEVIALTPALVGDSIFMTAPDSAGGVLRRLRARDDAVEAQDVWSTPMDTCHGGIVAVDGVLFGSWYRANRGFGALDAKTGQTLYRTRDPDMGSMVWADGRLYYLSERGIMSLIQADAAGFKVVGQFNLTPRRVGDAWAHPVILDGRLYLRYHDSLYCYDIQANATAP